MNILYTGIYKIVSRRLMKLASSALIFLFSLSVLAQEKTITGTVTSAEDGMPVPGATVVIKGTTQGTITDFDGNYSLVVGGDEAILQFSFVGFRTQDVSIGNQTNISIELDLDVTALEEVVVIGYGTQKKKVVTGATAQVSGEDLQKRVTTNALQAIQGQAAGVSIRPSSGQPGEGFKVNIRGLGTIGNSGPLYVVDGVQTGDIKYLNNADIASVDVLKDAASAAIYGSRAANGVVLITTKHGRPGKSQLTFDAYYGVQNRPKKLDMLNARQYAEIMNEQHLNSGGAVGARPFPDLDNLPAYVDGRSADTNWQDEMFSNNAVTQNYTIGLSGGSEETVYSASFSYTGQEGILGGPKYSNYDRYTARINTENKFYDGMLKVGENLTYTYVEKNGVSVGNQYDNTLRGAFNTSPILPIYDSLGNFFNSNGGYTDQNGDLYWNPTESSPYASMALNNQNERNEQKLIANVYALLEPVKNLTFRGSVGVDLYSDEYRSYTPAYTLSQYAVRAYNEVEQNMSRSRTLQLDFQTNYSISRGNHNLDFMLGASAREFNRSWLKGVNSTLPFNDFDHAWLNNASNQEYQLLKVEGAPIDDDEENGEHKLLSYFGRAQYNFAEKYLLNATVRMDGSSNFAKGNRWGIFPSVSAGWVLSEERFLEQVSIVGFLKLRASWGQNGNQNIPAFQYLAPLRFDKANYAFGEVEGVSTPGAYQNRLSFEGLKWETSEQINFGIDARLLNNDVYIAIDWYQKSTIDWLIEKPILATAGADAPVINGGRVQNTGIEMEITYSNSVGLFNYSVSANGAYNQNDVKNIPNEEGRILGGENQLFANAPAFYVAEEGHPIGYFWGLQTKGLFQTNSDVQSYKSSSGDVIQPNAKSGDMRYVDQNDDGVINDLDKIELGNPNPPVNLGFTLSGDYKGFDFSIMTYGSFGHQIVQSYRDQSNKFGNYTTQILGRWTGEGTSNSVPRLTNSSVNFIQFSDYYVQDGDFYRIGNVTIGYDLAKILNSAKISQFRVYAAVNNLYTFTKYTGMDPDIGYGFDNGVQDRFSSGIDVGFYPNPRTAMLGVSLKF